MGCCYSLFCKDENSSQAGEPNERTHLLVDPVSNSTNIQSVNSEDILSRNLNTLPKKTDEQSALNRILQETATNVIDVAALDSHNLQQHEYLERMKMYNTKVQQVFATNKSKISKRLNNCILQDIPAPDKILSLEPIISDDINLKDYALGGEHSNNEIEAENILKCNNRGTLKTVTPLRTIISSVVAAASAIQDIKVDHKEDLVEPFGLNC